MDVKGDGRGQKRARIEEEVDLCEMLERDPTRAKSRKRRRLRDGDAFNGLAVVRFVTDVSCNITGNRKSASDSKGGKKPGRFGNEIVEGNWMRDAVRTRPVSCRRGSGEIADFAPLAGGETEVRATCPGSECFEDSCSGVVV